MLIRMQMSCRTLMMELLSCRKQKSRTLMNRMLVNRMLMN
jgi:hypothetical protein